MRILHVIQAFYPCQIWGGPPQNTLTLAKGMQSRGHEVEILTTNVLDYRQRLSPATVQREWEGIPVTYLKAHWFSRRPNSMGFIIAPDLWRYRRLIKEADVVHIHGYRHFLFVGATMLARKYGVPVVAHARGALPSGLGRSKLKRIFDWSFGRRIMSRASAAVALNDMEIEEYARLGVRRDGIEKILNPFDPGLCTDLPDGIAFRERYGIGRNEKLVLFLARLHEKKGLELLLRAVAALGRTDVRLCVVGPDDGYESSAKQLISELEINHLTQRIGPLHGSAKFEAYRAADAYVLPTKGYEGLPTTILEACYAETPIVVTRTTEVAQLVDGRVGTAIDYDVDQLCSALKSLFDDPSLARRFRRNAQEFLAEHFGLENTMDQFEQLYRSATQQPIRAELRRSAA